MQLTPDVQRVRDGLSDGDQKVFDTLLSIVEMAEPSFQNRIQWQKPTFTLNDNWHHWIFSFVKTKTGVTLSFHKGWLLEDPHNLLSSDGKYLRIPCFPDLPETQKNAVKELIRVAIRHQFDL